jgi:putative FmdB family regulatory protein
MPIYDFLCDACGVFPVMSSIAGRDGPRDCPACGARMARAVSAPSLALMAGSRRDAHATNERAAHAPRLSGSLDETPASRHRPGCGCCSGGKIALAGASGGTQPGGMKGPAGGRPWMISH